MAFFTYIVECSDGSLYTGWTNDLELRISQHNSGRGARYTRAHAPVKLRAYWTFESRSQAMKEEWRIKRLPRQKKLLLIS